MTVVAQKMSALEFLELPDVQAGAPLELVKGEVIVSPRPSRFHSYTCVQLVRVLSVYLETHPLGTLYVELDTIFDVDEVRAPDILFFSRQRMPARHVKVPDSPPDLCIEILSPSNGRTDRVDKFALYQAKGVAHYWIVDPEERTVEAYALQNGQYVSSGRGGDNDTVHLPPFAELAIALGQLWHP